ncbi:MAG: SDR family NAD(P)-dependent oxidoreductase [Saprospiraceae bacterium]|nr:SDR family NAD(P)-dependent oxidoreductase [Saprospiraceae bacterium]
MNEVALITGASSGIGRATARLFATKGIRKLFLCARRRDRLEALAAELSAFKELRVVPIAFDIRDQYAVAGALDAIKGELEEVDVLINNAGLAKGFGPIHEGSLPDWETMIDTNVKGLLYITRIIAPGMVARRSGHIINVCSTAGKEVYPGGNVYCATKFAVDALTKALRQDLYTYGVRVGQIAPGHVEETEFALTRFDGDAERANIYSDFQPLKATDVAEIIYFMVSRPHHVNIQDVLVMSSQQASASLIHRSGRER